MASGHVNALKGRTHGCTDQCCTREKSLANSELSIHGPSRHATPDRIGSSRKDDRNRRSCGL
jgi:hypothetical protein